MNTHSNTHTQTHRHTDTQTHTHIYTHTHTHTHTLHADKDRQAGQTDRHTHNIVTWFSLSIVSTTEGCTGDGVEHREGELHDVSATGAILSFSASCDSTGGGGVAGGSALDNCTSASASSACNNYMSFHKAPYL